jgi:excinuclease UvrABC nuclease subunit
MMVSNIHSIEFTVTNTEARRFAGIGGA